MLTHLTFHSNWLKDLQCLTPIGWKIFGDRRVRCCSCWSYRASSLQIRAIKKGRKENIPFFSFRQGTVIPNKIFGPWDINLAAKGRLWRQLSVGENLWQRKVKYCIFNCFCNPILQFYPPCEWWPHNKSCWGWYARSSCPQRGQNCPRWVSHWEEGTPRRTYTWRSPATFLQQVQLPQK